MPASSFSGQILTDFPRKGGQFKLRPHFGFALKGSSATKCFPISSEGWYRKMFLSNKMFSCIIRRTAQKNCCLCSISPGYEFRLCSHPLSLYLWQAALLSQLVKEHTRHTHTLQIIKNSTLRNQKPQKPEDNPSIFKCLCDSNPSSFFVLLTRIPNWDMHPLIFYHLAWLIIKTKGNTHCQPSPLGLTCEWNSCSPHA